METITVKQDHGGDSTVEVHDDSTHDALGRYVQTLVFRTDQSLKSQSGRAWNVKEAIRRYCYERGFEIVREDQLTVTARYNPRAHSAQAYGQVRDAILADPRYKDAQQAAAAAHTDVARRFAPAVGQLHNLIRALEAKADAEAKAIDAGLAQVSDGILSEMELPAHLLSEDYNRLARGVQPPTVTALSYSRRGDDLPTDLAAILALLD